MAGRRSRLPELETAPKSIPLIETATLLSLVAAVVAVCLFAWIAQSVSRQQATNFDLSVRTHIHQYASPRMTKAMVAVSFLGEEGLAFACIVAFAAFTKLRWRRATVWLVIAIAGALILNFTLKYAFHRLRPTPFFEPPLSDYSFPSGHALFSFCLYGVIAGLWADRVRSLAARITIWGAAALIVGVVGLSRIYLGVHYPSDVIAGYLAATIWVRTLIAMDCIRTRRKTARHRAGLTTRSG